MNEEALDQTSGFHSLLITYYSLLQPEGLGKVLPLNSILIDEELQSRVKLHEQTLEEYTEAYAQGVEFPPVIVFYDSEQYFLSDGFHRVKAAIAAGLTEIPVEIKQGTKRDAILYSVGANAKHGLRRTNADKRRAVMTLLDDPEWRTWIHE